MTQQIIEVVDKEIEDTTILKYENVATLGDKIKAYDFDPTYSESPFYLEGIVLDKGFLDKPYKCYLVKVTKIVYNGFDKTDSFYEYMKKIKQKPWKYVPFETDDEFNGRVTNITERKICVE
jgi:hypothetical protein